MTSSTSSLLRTFLFVLFLLISVSSSFGIKYGEIAVRRQDLTSNSQWKSNRDERELNSSSTSNNINSTIVPTDTGVATISPTAITKTNVTAESVSVTPSVMTPTSSSKLPIPSQSSIPTPSIGPTITSYPSLSSSPTPVLFASEDCSICNDTNETVDRTRNEVILINNISHSCWNVDELGRTGDWVSFAENNDNSPGRLCFNLQVKARTNCTCISKSTLSDDNQKYSSSSKVPSIDSSVVNVVAVIIIVATYIYG